MPLRTLIAVSGLALCIAWTSGARAQAPAGQRRPAAAPLQLKGPPPAAGPRAPFELNTNEKAALEQLLLDWHNAGKDVKTFKCTFTLYQYDTTFGPKQKSKTNPNAAWREGTGQLKYSKPDHGMFQVEEVKTWDATKTEWGQEESGEHWVCDGKFLYELDPRQKQMRVRPLPPNMQGQGIADGPLPFLFGADVKKLQARFWMRIITPKEAAETQVWIQAYPKWPADAANYQRAELILNRGDLQPVALRVIQLNGSPWTYQFKSIKVNDVWSGLMRDFAAPTKPFGWSKVLIDPGQPGPAGQPPEQALLPGAGAQR
jgi:TIGR03009 family protein